MTLSLSLQSNERALLIRDGQPKSWLGPGRHRVWGWGADLQAITYDLDRACAVLTPELRAVLPPEAAEVLEVANSTVYAIPLVSVTEALADHEADIHSVNGLKTLRLRQRLLPMIDLANALGDSRPRSIEAGRFVVAARHGERQVAFTVDRLLGEQDVVVKSLGDLVGNRKGLTGATILGDGSLGLIVDTASLVSEQAMLATA